LLVLARSFVSESLTSGELAVAFGGIILAQGALKSITESVSYLSGAAIAWKKVKLLFEAGSREEMPGSPAIGLLDSRSLHFTTEPVMDAHDLAYGHQGRAERTLAGCSLRVQKGDRILLEGPSGGGKSTLASILAGLREPQSGLMIIGGLDRQTLGLRAWRRVVACAPQFHENHIFAGTLAFNLLMGRHWPPTEDDLQDAENLCRELGLGDLLDRMPAGLQQTIGETGWQLSYGERCRVFLARALLQGAELIILDESFGALDPDTLQKAAECVRKWAPTLMIIAHP
jgi:ATP-binding cassette subfamily B protein